MRKVLAVVVFALLVGCGGNAAPTLDPTRNLSPAGKAAYQTLKVAKMLAVVRDVVAEGERQKVFTPDSALAFLDYHTRVLKTMDAVPGGWKAIALSGLDRVKESMSAGEWNQLEPFINLLRSLIDAFVPPPPQARIEASFILMEGVA